LLIFEILLSPNDPAESKKYKMKNFFIHESSYIEESAKVGKGTKIWHFSHVMANCELGKNCNIGQNVVISPNVKLGENVKIQNNVSIYTGVIAEDNVFIGPSVVFTNIINPRSSVNRRGEYIKTILCEGSSIGANSTIICGVIIGKYSLIGAGSVVTKNVQNYSLVVGNPARHVGWVSQYGNKLKFDESGFAICNESKQKYVLLKNEVKLIDETT